MPLDILTDEDLEGDPLAGGTREYRLVMFDRGGEGSRYGTGADGLLRGRVRGESVDAVFRRGSRGLTCVVSRAELDIVVRIGRKKQLSRDRLVGLYKRHTWNDESDTELARRLRSEGTTEEVCESIETATETRLGENFVQHLNSSGEVHARHAGLTVTADCKAATNDAVSRTDRAARNPDATRPGSSPGRRTGPRSPGEPTAPPPRVRRRRGGDDRLPGQRHGRTVRVERP